MLKQNFYNGNEGGSGGGGGGITSINGITASTQTLAVGTSGNNFGISSSGSSHTFNLPDAGPTSRGALTSADWNTFNNKVSSVPTTAGAISYGNGTTLTSDSTKLFFDSTNKKIFVGDISAAPNSFPYDRSSITHYKNNGTDNGILVGNNLGYTSIFATSEGSVYSSFNGFRFYIGAGRTNMLSMLAGSNYSQFEGNSRGLNIGSFGSNPTEGLMVYTTASAVRGLQVRNGSNSSGSVFRLETNGALTIGNRSSDSIAGVINFQTGSGAATKGRFNLDGQFELYPVGASAGQTAEMRYYTLGSANYVGFKAANSLSGNTTWVLPTADGAANTVIGTNGSGALSFRAPVISWTEITGTSQALTVNRGFIANNGSQVDLLLPATAAVGDVIEIAGSGAGGWRVSQNASQIIHVGATSSQAGTGGYITSQNRYDAVKLLCIVANTEFVAITAMGTLFIQT